jgi:hypothetical protein
MDSKLSKYIRYFILGGCATIFVNYILENFEDGPALSAYIYCAPTIYLIIMYLVYIDRGINGYYTFITHSIINYIANILILFLLIFLTKYTKIDIYLSFSIATIVFLFYSIYYFMYVYKKKFIV